VQARYKPVLARANLIETACKKAVSPFLVEKDRKQRQEANELRERQEAIERDTQEAFARTSVTDVEGRAKAEELAEQAKAADKAATRAANATAQAKGGDRAMGLRTTYRAELTDLNAAVRHFWKLDPAPFEALVCDLAAKAVLAKARDIPGFKIIEEKGAV
jgi:hypothetical protein